ncbi:MAG: serine hydrolase [Candidatus Dormibacteraceae bacterium]
MGSRERVRASLLTAAVILAVATLGGVDVHANQRTLTPSAPMTPAIGEISPALSLVRGSNIEPSGAVTLAPIPSIARDVSQVALTVGALIGSSGGVAGVTVVELGGAAPVSWSVNGDQIFTAASTYKLAALMLEADNIAAGKTDANGTVCFEADDYESGWFDDYADGVCFTRNELGMRAGIYSDNTAGHMLVRDVGGAEVLNAWAASIGATSSQFFDPNTTTPADLAALWVAEANGELGGVEAQSWLYPMLTRTRTESGVPAGLIGATVVHKTGTIDLVENDAALVTSGPDGGYIVVVMTDGIGGAAGWQLIAQVSAAIWQFEGARSD